MTAEQAASRSVAVFGSSDPIETDPLYETARQVGRLLARSGFVVVTGGYAGVMEAASRGALEAGGTTLGITTRALSPLRAAPNPYLTLHLEEADLFDRTRELIGRSAGYIILPGKAGTLAELTFLWALNRARLLQDRPIVLLGASWRSYLEQVATLALVDRREIEITHVAATPEEAVDMIRSRI
ncbi:MAG TPA: LOG family protein [Patescibacteria group bacterium]|jgi:uncharacterized protein (TIGR00730 family)|nr:LOG family protein [Patescibacteria group bacterium]